MCAWCPAVNLHTILGVLVTPDYEHNEHMTNNEVFSVMLCFLKFLLKKQKLLISSCFSVVRTGSFNVRH